MIIGFLKTTLTLSQVDSVAGLDSSSCLSAPVCSRNAWNFGLASRFDGVAGFFMRELELIPNRDSARLIGSSFCGEFSFLREGVVPSYPARLLLFCLDLVDLLRGSVFLCSAPTENPAR